MRHPSLIPLLVGILLLLFPAQLFSDELHKKDGSILYGRVEKSTGTRMFRTGAWDDDWFQTGTWVRERTPRAVLPKSNIERFAWGPIRMRLARKPSAWRRRPSTGLPGMMSNTSSTIFAFEPARSNRGCSV